MSAVLQALKAQAAAAAKVAEINMSEVSKGGAGRRLLPEGYALARLVRYLEFGKHPGEFQGKPKPPQLEVRMGFAVWGDTDPANPGQPDKMYHSVDANGKWIPGILNSFDMKLGNNEKAKLKLGFDRMNYKGTATHFAEFLGEPFIIKVVVKQGKAKDAKPYNDIDWANILPPFDPVSKQPYQVPEATDDLYQLFLWDCPTKEGWDSIFIDGKNDKGESKNFMQAKCLKATDFPGSALEQMLAGNLPDITGPVESDNDPEEEAPGVPEVPAVTATVAATSTPNPNLAPAVAVPSVPDVPFDGGHPAVVTAPAVTTPVAPAVTAPVAPVVTAPSIPVITPPAVPTV